MTKLKRGDLVQGEHGQYLVVKGESGLDLWDFKAWAEGYYDAYIPLDNRDDEFTLIGNVHENHEFLPPECDGYFGEPSVECVGVIYKNPAFNPEYARPHCYEHSIGYSDDKEICICGKERHDIIHELEKEVDTLK